jgi:hypothetical protein
VRQTEDKLYFFNEIPQGNDLSIVVRPKGLHIDQPKVEIKYGHGVMGQASSFDDLLSGKTKDAGKTGGTSLTSSKYFHSKRHAMLLMNFDRKVLTLLLNDSKILTFTVPVTMEKSRTGGVPLCKKR